MALPVGARVPEFTARDQDGETIRSHELEGRRYVLYFYPHDDTPICTRQACAFEAARGAFDDLGVPVFGVSANGVKSHDRFARKHGLGFRLLADPDRALVRAFDATGLLGRISRITYIIGPQGTIEARRKAELSGRGHADWAREQVALLQAEAPF